MDKVEERLLRDVGRIVLTVSALGGLDNVLLPPRFGNDASLAAIRRLRAQQCA
jgi:hypothetical protein